MHKRRKLVRLAQGGAVVATYRVIRAQEIASDTPTVAADVRMSGRDAPGDSFDTMHVNS